MKGKGLKAINWVMFIIFVFGAIVQYNDPDPLTWIPIYLGAAIVVFLDLLASRRWEPGAILALATIGWGVTIAPRVIGKVPFMSMFGAWEMKNMGIEESREMYGLFMIGVWCAILAYRALRRGRAGSPASA